MPSIAESTVVAVSTPPGIGGIAVLRISGPKALLTASKVTHLPKKRFKNRYALLAPLHSSQGKEIDTGIVTYFQEPNSYTGEDVVEISCHGGNVISKALVEACLSVGCEPAPPGEFTKRAFLHGKMDLSQAESVAHVISATTALAEQISYRNLSGKLSSFLNRLKKNVVNTLAIIEAELDFSEEEIDSSPPSILIAPLDEAITACEALLASYATGRMLTQGAVVSIIGGPNVGKSSLLNAIVSENRVLVTDTPGTTRDAVEVLYQIDGVPVRFFDTAGIRLTDDPVEQMGISLSANYIARSDLLLWIFDVLSDREEIFRQLKNPPFSIPFIALINKIDLCNESSFSDRYLRDDYDLRCISAKTGSGIRELLRDIRKVLVVDERTMSTEVFLTSSRHRNSIRRSLRCLSTARDMISAEVGREIVAMQLRQALYHVDRILGVTTVDDILDNIFSTFCVGK